MSFSSDIGRFSSESKAKIDDNVAAQNERIELFLKEHLGDDASLVVSVTFDNDKKLFRDVDAPPHVIERMRAAGFLCEE